MKFADTDVTIFIFFMNEINESQSFYNNALNKVRDKMSWHDINSDTFKSVLS